MPRSDVLLVFATRVPGRRTVGDSAETCVVVVLSNLLPLVVAVGRGDVHPLVLVACVGATDTHTILAMRCHISVPSLSLQSVHLTLAAVALVATVALHVRFPTISHEAHVALFRGRVSLRSRMKKSG